MHSHRCGIRLLAVTVLFLACHPQAFPAVFNVANTNDSGPGSLRDAINQANAAGGSSTINIFLNNSILTLESGLPVPTVNLTITGSVRIFGNNTFGPLMYAGAGKTTNLSNFVLAGAFNGPALQILPNGTVNLDQMNFFTDFNNSGFGGAINALAGSNVTITNSSIHQNGAVAGGGIYVTHGNLTVTTTWFNDNGASSGVGRDVDCDQMSTCKLSACSSYNDAAAFGSVASENGAALTLNFNTFLASNVYIDTGTSATGILAGNVFSGNTPGTDCGNCGTPPNNLIGGDHLLYVSSGVFPIPYPTSDAILGCTVVPGIPTVDMFALPYPTSGATNCGSSNRYYTLSAVTTPDTTIPIASDWPVSLGLDLIPNNNKPFGHSTPPDIPVTAGLVSGTGGLNFGTPLIDPLTGMVTVNVTFDTPGSKTVRFTAPGTTPLDESVNVIGPPNSITIQSGNNQTVAVGSAFNVFSVLVADVAGTPLAGQNVHFTAAASGPGCSFPGPSNTATVPTNAQGVATSPTCTANQTVGDFNVSAGDSPAPAAMFTLHNAPNAVNVTVQTSPDGLQFTANGTPHSTSVTFPYAPGTPLPLGTTTPQFGAGTQFDFDHWSDNGVINHSPVVPSSDTTYTAFFNTSYQLTTAVSPTGGGTVTPATGSYFPAGTVQPVTATPNANYVFGGWSGPVANPNSANTTVTLNGPTTVTARFDPLTTFQTNPAGLMFRVDTTTYTGGEPLLLSPGAHTVAAVTPQPAQPGVQYVFGFWSDGLPATHDIAVGNTPATLAITYTTQYQLTTAASPANGGAVVPATGSFFDAGTMVDVMATPNAGFAFTTWTGNVAAPNQASTTITMGSPQSITANFAASNFTLDPVFAPAPAAGGTASVNVIASLPSATWAAVSNSGFLAPFSPAGGTGSGTLNYAVAPNTSYFSRVGTMTIAGQIFTVNQAGVPEVISLSSPSANFATAGGSGSFTATITPADAPWTASKGVPWITIDSAASGLGSTTVDFTVAPNTSPGPRTGTITVAEASVPGGASKAFTVTQQGTMINSGGLGFYPLVPCRVVDTRVGFGKDGTMFGPPILAGNAVRTFPILSSSCHIPSTAQAYAFNITVVPPAPLTYLTIWPAGLSQPFVSTLNSFDGAVVANAAIVPAGTNGDVSVFVSNDTQLIIDVNGYFAPPDSQALAFFPSTPCRVADTRLANGTFGGPIMAAQQTRDFPIPASACGIIPSTARAYSLNVTVVPNGPLTYLSAGPAGLPLPLVSTLNAFDGRVVANAAIVPAGTAGAISVFVSDSTQAILDINGYFASPAQGGLYYHSSTPCRIVDTRPNQGTSGFFGPPSMPGNASRDFPILSSSCGLPPAAEAYSLNFTVVPPGPVTYLTTWPAGQPQPFVSTLNSFLGKVVANAAIVPAGGAPAPPGSISAFVSNPTDLIIDSNGYFAR